MRCGISSYVSDINYRILTQIEEEFRVRQVGKRGIIFSHITPMKIVRTLSVFSMLCAFYFLVVIISLHFVRTDLNFYAVPLSYFRVSSNSYYLSSGFLLAALAEMMLAGLLKYLLSSGEMAASKLGRYLLFLAAASFLLTGIFKFGRIHWLGALSQMMLFPPAAMMITVSLKEGTAKHVSIFISSAAAVLFLTLSQAYGNVSAFHPLYGLLEKMNVVLMVSWSVMMLVLIYKATLKSPNNSQNS